MLNYREKLTRLIASAQEIHAVEKSMTMQSLHIIGELEVRRAAPNSGMSVDQFARHIGLSKDQYLKRSSAARTLRFVPEAKPLLEQGEISMSHLTIIAAKVTQANRQVVLENIKGKSLRDAKLFMSRVTPTGELLPREEICEIKIILTKSQIALLERAREVLAAGGSVPTDAEVFVKAVGDLLTKRDPVMKAERAASRQQSAAAKSAESSTAHAAEQRGSSRPADHVAHVDHKGQQARASTGAAQDDTKPEDRRRRYIPAASRHEVWQRDQGQCAHVYGDGSRCTERMMLEVDHQTLYCRGGQHTVDNLRLKCRLHNSFAAAQALGQEWLAQKLGRD